MTTTKKSPKSPQQTIKSSTNPNKKVQHAFPFRREALATEQNSFGCNLIALSKLFNRERAVLWVYFTLMKTLSQQTCLCLYDFSQSKDP